MVQHPPITLRYFVARGRAQAVRYLFAARGIAYTDERVPLSIGAGAVWPAMKEDRSLGRIRALLGRVERPLAESGRGATPRSRPVMRAGCLVSEGPDVPQEVFAEGLRLGEQPTLARVSAESAGRRAVKEVLAAHSA